MKERERESECKNKGRQRDRHSQEVEVDSWGEGAIDLSQRSDTVVATNDAEAVAGAVKRFENDTNAKQRTASK